jgi:hypothetical protein
MPNKGDLHAYSRQQFPFPMLGGKLSKELLSNEPFQTWSE